MKGHGQNWKYILLLLIFAGISYLSLIAVYHIASDQTAFLSLHIFSAGLFVKMAALILIYYAADILRFYFVLRAMGVSVPLRYMGGLAFVNIFISNITPSATGGGFAQIYLLHKKGVSIGAATAGSSIRTALPIIFFSICTPLILIFDPNISRLFSRSSMGAAVFVMLVLDLVAIWFVVKLIRQPEAIVSIFRGLRDRFVQKGRTGGSRLIKLLDKLILETGTFSKHFIRFLQGDKRYVALSILATFIFLSSLFLIPTLLIRDLNPQAPAMHIVLTQVVVTTIMYFAPTPGASGVAEAAFVALLAGYVSSGDVVPLTFAWRMFSIYIGVLVGFVVFYFQIMKKHEMIELS
jgi:glycosyltransferase 2 family protein